MTKRMTLTITLFLFILSIFAMVILITIKNRQKEVDFDNYDLDIQVITKSFPTTVIIYGEEIIFRENIILNKINEIDVDSLNTNTNYNFLIIVDFEGGLTISSDEWEIIKDFSESKNNTFLYLGKSLFPEISDVFNVRIPSNGELSFYYFNEYGMKDYTFELWVEEDDFRIGRENEILGYYIISDFVKRLKRQ